MLHKKSAIRQKRKNKKHPRNGIVDRKRNRKSRKNVSRVFLKPRFSSGTQTKILPNHESSPYAMKRSTSSDNL